MATKIWCETTDKGVQSFYVRAEGEIHFLFSQTYHAGVKRFYGGGVDLDSALSFKRASGDHAIIHTMEKLPIYLRYIEREYGITLLRKTEKRARRRIA